MRRSSAFNRSASSLFWVRLSACLVLLATVAACGSHSTRQARTHYNPSRYYPPPGPSSDPWGPYIHEASRRYSVPEVWIRRVMRQESGGQEDVISWAGAMGLMQVMPDTYDGLRSRYNLGSDPFDPHNNIMAGTAYLREMYDRFGAPGFLAAYNAGPNRLDRYLSNGTPLPDETVNYVASIAPLLGPETPMSGPLAVYAGPLTRFAVQRTPTGCDPDAAFNPNGPCTPSRPAAEPVVVAANVPPAYRPAGEQAACDPDAAYDPSRPCQAPPSTQAALMAAPDEPRGACDPDAAYDPSRRCQPVPGAPAPVIAQALPPVSVPVPVPPTAPPRQTRYAGNARPIQESMALPVTFAPGPPPGHWAIQVGAFASLAIAQAAAENARAAVPDVLRKAKIELPATAPFGRQVAFRARLSGLSAAAATDACSRLTTQGMSCLTVSPTRNSF